MSAATIANGDFEERQASDLDHLTPRLRSYVASLEPDIPDQTDEQPTNRQTGESRFSAENVHTPEHFDNVNELRLSDRLKRAEPTDWRAVRDDKFDWLWQDVLPSRGLSMLAGPSGSGKSLLANFLMAKAASGTPFPCGTKSAPVKCALWTTEQSGGMALGRVLAAGVPLCNFHHFSRDLQLPRDTAILSDSAGRYGHKLIFVDSISARTTKDFNNSGDVSAVLNSLEAVCEELQVAIVVIHHTRKNSVQGRAVDMIRGSGRVVEGVQVANLVVRLDEETLFLGTAKNNAGRKMASTFQVQERRTHRDGETTAVVDFVEYSEQDADDVLQELSSGQRRITRHRKPRSLPIDEKMRNALADGPVNSKVVKNELTAHGFSDNSIRSSRERLQVNIEPRGKNESFWSLPKN